jgi:hypothetical protein
VKQIVVLEQQQAAFDVVIRSYEPDYSPVSDGSAVRRRRKLDGVDMNGISVLFKGFDRRSFVLRTLQEAGRPITTADFAAAFARENGLGEYDARLGLIGNRFSRTWPDAGELTSSPAANETELVECQLVQAYSSKDHVALCAEVSDVAFQDITSRQEAALAEPDAGGVPVARTSPGSSAALRRTA